MIDKKIKGYQIPDGYFDTLYERVSKQLLAEPKSTGMTVPEGYFDRVQESVLRTVESAPLRVVHRGRQVRQWSVAAASLVLLAITAVALWPASERTLSDAQLTQVSIDALLEDADMLEDLSLQQLAMLMEEEEIDNIGVGLMDQQEVPDDLLEQIDLEDLEDFF